MRKKQTDEQVGDFEYHYVRPDTAPNETAESRQLETIASELTRIRELIEGYLR